MYEQVIELNDLIGKTVKSIRKEETFIVITFTDNTVLRVASYYINSAGGVKTTIFMDE